MRDDMPYARGMCRVAVVLAVLALQGAEGFGYSWVPGCSTSAARGGAVVMCDERPAQASTSPNPRGDRPALRTVAGKVAAGMAAVSLACSSPQATRAQQGQAAAVGASETQVQSGKKVEPGQVAVAAGVAASGIYLFRRAGGPDSGAADGKASNPLLAAIAPKPKPENATEIVAGMQPMLKEWEKALESAQAAQLKLASLDPAKNSSGLVSIWYTFDPLKTRDTTIAPLQDQVALTEQAVNATNQALTEYIGKVKSNAIQQQCKDLMRTVQQRRTEAEKAREAEVTAQKAAKEAAEKAAKAEARAKEEAEARARAAVRKTQAQQERQEEERNAQLAAEDRARKELLASLEAKARDIVQKNKREGTQTLLLDAMLAAKKLQSASPSAPAPPGPGTPAPAPKKPAAVEGFDALGDGSKYVSAGEEPTRRIGSRPSSAVTFGDPLDPPPELK